MVGKKRSGAFTEHGWFLAVIVSCKPIQLESYHRMGLSITLRYEGCYLVYTHYLTGCAILCAMFRDMGSKPTYQTLTGLQVRPETPKRFQCLPINVQL